MASPDERETTLTVTDADDVVRVWSNRRKDITKLRRHPLIRIVREGIDQGTVWVEAEIPADKWNPVSGAKRASKPLTPEQRAAAAERLRQAREAQRND
jgi:hypothetical protein